MNKAFFLFRVTLLILGQSSTAQTSFWNSRNAYLGQSRPGDTPKIFAPGLLADKREFTANRTAISADGKEIYYCTNKSWKNSNDLKVKCFKYDGKKWVGPVIINEHMGQTSFSPDDQNLYFANDQSAGTVYKSHRTKTGWSDPVAYIERNYLIYDFMLTRSGNKYAASNGTWGRLLMQMHGGLALCLLRMLTRAFRTWVHHSILQANGDFFLTRLIF
jgi:hypothetical protein